MQFLLVQRLRLVDWVINLGIDPKEDIVSADGLGTIYHKAGDKVATIVTNDKGIARIDDLPLGQ